MHVQRGELLGRESKPTAKSTTDYVVGDGGSSSIGTGRAARSERFLGSHTEQKSSNKPASQENVLLQKGDYLSGESKVLYPIPINTVKINPITTITELRMPSRNGERQSWSPNRPLPPLDNLHLWLVASTCQKYDNN